MNEKIRHVIINGFEIELYATSRTDWRGQTVLGYRVKAPTGDTVDGIGLCGSPMHADDSNETLSALCSFLSTPSCWDRENEEEAACADFAENHGEMLSMIGMELEEGCASIEEKECT